MTTFMSSLVKKKLIVSAIGLGFASMSQAQVPSLGHLDNSEYRQCQLEFKVNTEWNGGYTGEIALTNLDSKPIHKIDVSFEGNFELDQVWNATLNTIRKFENGNRFNVLSQAWNRDLMPGETMTVGVEISSMNMDKPFNLLVNGQPCAERRAGGFFTSWAIYRDGEAAYDMDDIPVNDVNQIIHAFAIVNQKGLAEVGDVYADLGYVYQSSPLTGHLNQYQKLKENNPDMSLVISVAEVDHAGINFSLAASTHAHRQAFAKSILSFIDQYGFNGVDIDWEFPSSKDDQLGFTELLKELRYQLDEKGLQDGEYYTLSADLPIAAYQMEYIDLEQFHQYVDQVNIMTYLYHGTWFPFTFHNAPLLPNYQVGIEEPLATQLSVQWSIEQYVNAGVPRHKLNLGIPLFGSSWRNVPDLNNGLAQHNNTIQADSVISYRDALSLHKNEGYYLGWDDISKNSYLYHPTKKDGHFIQFDDIRTVKEKLEWAKEQGLGGAFAWEMTFDDLHQDSILPVMAESLKAESKR